MKSAGRPLRLHRETLRHLCNDQLVGVAGGFPAPKENSPQEDRPRSNAWTQRELCSLIP